MTLMFGFRVSKIWEVIRWMVDIHISNVHLSGQMFDILISNNPVRGDQMDVYHFDIRISNIHLGGVQLDV